MDEEDELDYFELEILRAGERKDFINDEVLVCECMCISAKEIKDFFIKKRTNLIDLDDLKSELGLGSGCSSCIKSFSSWKDKIF